MVGDCSRSHGHVPVFGIAVQLDWELIERRVQVMNVPHFTPVDEMGRTNAAILAQFVKLARRDSKVARSLNAPESSPWYRPRFR